MRLLGSQVASVGTTPPSTGVTPGKQRQSGDGKKARVLIIQSEIKQYRVPFYAKLNNALKSDGIELRVVYSGPQEVQALRGDNMELPADIGIKVPGHWFLGTRLFYQSVTRQALAADLVIVEPAVKYLHTYMLLVLRMLPIERLAFFGPGWNKRRYRWWLAESLRPWIVRRADWWFTYTEGTADWLAASGVSRKKITVVQNSVDTRTFAEQVAAVPDDQVRAARKRLGINPGSRVGIYCGVLASDKGVPLLLEAARLVREHMPNFHLLILGGGPERERVEKAAREAPWIHYLGPRFGVEKALFLKMSDCFLLPGCVGLAILDSFAAGLPLMTTKVSSHGPEVEYLEESMNGRMVENNAEAYAESVTEVLSNPALLEHLKCTARKSANRYSIEAMAMNFRDGILRCLHMDHQSPAGQQS